MYSRNEIIPIAKKIIGSYYLCDSCLGRMFSRKLKLSSNKRLGEKIKKEFSFPIKNCFICKNIFEEIPFHLKKMEEVSKEFEFSSFVVGTKIKPSIIDRDDQIRSEFKIRGIDGIKTAITHEISKRFATKTKKRIDFLDPEVTLTLDLKEKTCQIRSKHLFLQGRYSKTKRGLPQKQKPCENCSGKGCRACNFHGITSYESIEGLVSKILFRYFGGTVAKFTWVGGEDKSSLVFGRGRPFFVKLQNPQKRWVILPKKIKDEDIEIKNFKIISEIPKKPLSFKSVITLSIITEKEVSSSSLKKLNLVTSSPIIIYEKSGRRSEKKIFVVTYRKNSKNNFILTIESDGGIPIKRFVKGDDVVPGISQILNVPCFCDSFDFHEIKMTTNN